MSYYTYKPPLEIQVEAICTSVRNASQGNIFAWLLTNMLPPDTTMPFIVEKLQGDTRLRVVREIVKLTESQPSKLPTVVSIFPNTWVPFEVFVFLVRDHGFPINTNKDKRRFVDLLDKTRK